MKPLIRYVSILKFRLRQSPNIIPLFWLGSRLFLNAQEVRTLEYLEIGGSAGDFGQAGTKNAINLVSRRSTN